MSALDAWKREIRSLIPRGFLRRDQGAGLLISDFPRLGNEEQIITALLAHGYSLEIRDGLAAIDGSPEKYRALERTLNWVDFSPQEAEWPLYALGMRLLRHPCPLEDQPMHWIRFVLKNLDGKKDEEILRLLPPGIALLQRQKMPLPSLAGALILDELFNRRKGAEEA